ncbi:Ankyrin repeat-containing protein [Oryctes borbonicus]|uniref:Ankyrin repeat-containing protein n=1 Tax=Oryctes borbonicus TaxID=1629725 RepID=A0A0T6BBQ6_9SCAR|nr:Ankyrin repeat-containing protein [Oryctes borbonicus]
MEIFMYIGAKDGYLNIVKYFVKHGADVDGYCKRGFTPLYLAAKSNQMDIVEFLLEDGADVNKRTIKGFTPLSIAIKQKCVNIVELLLRNGANVNKKNKGGFSPLSVAVRYGYFDTNEPLLRETKVKIKGDVNNALPVSAANGRLTIVRLLLNSGANVDNINGNKLLLAAATEGHLDVVKTLLEKGADANVRTKEGYTPLSIAIRRGHIAIAKILLKYLGVQNLQDVDQLFFLAVRYGHLNIIHLLLENDICMNEGISLLYTAAKEGFLDIVEFLVIQKGVNAKEGIKDGFTPFRIAAYQGNEQIVRFLVKNGEDVDDRDENGITLLLTLACTTNRECYNIARFLLDKGADVNVKAKNGFMPLHIAAISGCLHMFKLLCEKGADVDAKAEDGVTPRLLLREMGHSHILDYLKRDEGNVNA